MIIVDGNTTGTYEGIITIFGGYDEEAKIKRFVRTANGTDDDKFITLEDCRKMIDITEGNTVTVIFDDDIQGEIYQYGNYGDYWVKYGETNGYA